MHARIPKIVVGDTYFHLSINVDDDTSHTYFFFKWGQNVKNLRVNPRDLARTLYKCFGAAVAWELEHRWPSVGTGNFAATMLTDIGGDALTDSSYVKQFGRWKAWYSGDSSFASGSVDVIIDVVAWCCYRSLIKTWEAKALKKALLSIRMFADGSTSSEQFLEALPEAELALKQFIEVERSSDTKTMFWDRREGRKFRRSELASNAPRKVRLTAEAKRWKSIEAAVVAIESLERIVRIVEDEKRRAASWTFPKEDILRLRSDANRVVEQIFAVLHNSPLSENQINDQVPKLLDIVANHMASRVEELRDRDRAIKPPLKVSKFENKTYQPRLR